MPSFKKHKEHLVRFVTLQLIATAAGLTTLITPSGFSFFFFLTPYRRRVDISYSFFSICKFSPCCHFYCYRVRDEVYQIKTMVPKKPMIGRPFHGRTIYLSLRFLSKANCSQKLNQRFERLHGYSNLKIFFKSYIIMVKLL